MAVVKTKPISTTVRKSLDYICNPNKTDGQILISSYMCSPETADLEWEFTRSKSRSGGKQLARHLIQSFSPNEVNAETAHEIGIKFLEKILGGKYEYVISTHIDKGHVHNHIIFNTVNFKDFHHYQSNKASYNFLRKCSDELCKEYGLSVIEPSENKGKAYHDYIADKQSTSYKAILRKIINNQIIYAKDFDDFLLIMERENIEVKQGKYLSFRVSGQERFTRSKTLGEDYTEEAIRARIAGTYKPRISSLLIDIENNIKCQQSKGYEQWAKVYNLKQMAQNLIYLQENNLADYRLVLNKEKEYTENITVKRREIKTVETRIKEIDYIIKQIDIYRSNQNKSTESARILFEAAKKNLMLYINDNKLPSLKSLNAERSKLMSDKDKLYEFYHKLQADQKQFSIVKKNTDSILNIGSKKVEKEFTR